MFNFITYFRLLSGDLWWHSRSIKYCRASLHWHGFQYNLQNTSRFIRLQMRRTCEWCRL